MIWGTCPLVVHAALQCDFAMFRILLDHGAILPPDFLRRVISWDLGDWMINTGEWEGQLAAILECVRDTEAWPPLEQRMALASELEEFCFEWVSALLKEP
ncbi:MAG TPA: hypothetical protein VLE43_18085 [Candidatus Saccharimonadia bacterium]|nr:hypothetical protein [Candidatus Saccharimonadia bacterium]